jgi:hypothetical protein
VTVSVSPSAIQEGQTAAFTVTASTAVAQNTVVNYSMSGKATQGSDYTMSGTSGQIVIPAGSNSGSVTLTAIVDNVKEKKETAIMTLQPGSGYDFASKGKGKKSKPGKAPEAKLTITD